VGVGELLLCITEKTCCMIISINTQKSPKKDPPGYSEKIISYMILKPHHGIIKVKAMEVVAKYDLLK
tara:strand:+ start:680 stop:880 length:201 start_codon:yes stop_codon:yes gene_type:complete